MRKKKYNLENRKHFVYFAIIYTCICVTVMAFTVFFQYRAYTKNYNAVNSNPRIPFVTQDSLFVNENPVL